MNVVIRIEGWDRSGKDAVRLGCLWKKMTNFAAMLKECMMTGVVEAGCDEAGRGCLCGPVSCAAVILPPGFNDETLNDSKQLSARKREELRKRIESEATAWAVVMVPPEEIDEINILNASIAGMQRALDKLEVRPRHVLVDGNRFKPYGDIPWQTFVKGDGRFANIAAASILAKTERDLFMTEAHERFPVYAWNVNKGYPTAAHRRAIAEHGPSPLHRMTFRLV